MLLKTATVSLKSSAPYSQSKVVTAEKLPRETHDDYEKRTWKERLHTDKDGYVFIPASSFSNCIKEAAKFMSIPVPGQGKATYTKNFEAAVMVLDPVKLPVHKDDVEGLTLHVPSDGRRGGTKRVWKTFPHIHEWEGDVTFMIYDPIITEEVFQRVITAAGLLIGIGRGRPRNSGTNGRFTVEKIVWGETDV
jgi:hypothetical protein